MTGIILWFSGRGIRVYTEISYRSYLIFFICFIILFFIGEIVTSNQRQTFS